MNNSKSVDDKIILDLGKFQQNWKVNANPKKKLKLNDENKIWFDVDHTLIPESDLKSADQTKQGAEIVASHHQTTAEKSKVKLTKAIAIDCEMVGVGDDSRESILARVSLVNQLNQCVYDKYVIPREPITDYRTHVSGVRLEDLKKENGAVEFSIVQKEVAEIVKDRKLVGHALHNDLKVLFLSHPKKKIRDTQRCKLLRKKYPTLGPLASLKTLANVLLGNSMPYLKGYYSSIWLS
jgi:RNA exonuclease 4